MLPGPLHAALGRLKKWSNWWAPSRGQFLGLGMANGLAVVVSGLHDPWADYRAMPSSFVEPLLSGIQAGHACFTCSNQRFLAGF